MTGYRDMCVIMLQVGAAWSLLMFAGVACAQGQDATTPGQATTATPPANTEPAKPQAITPADIAPQADELNAWLREVNNLAEPAESGADITQKLPGLEREIERLVHDLATAPSVSLRGVSAARKHWTALDDQLDGWQEVLQKRSTELQQAHDELESKRVVWKLTRSDELPETVLQQIDSVLSALNSSEDAVNQRIKQVLTLQGQVSKHRDSTSKALGRLGEIEVSQRSNLFVRDQDPLWGALVSERHDLASEFAKSRSTIEAAFSELLERYKTHFAVHGALFLFLIVVIWLTRGAVSAGMMSDREVERVSIVLTRSFSTALLISLLMLRFIYPIVSSEIVLFERIILLFPLLRLLPKLLPEFRRMFVILTPVYIAQTMAQLAVEGSLVQRLLLLATTAMAISVLSVKLARLYRNGQAERTWMQRLVRVLGWLGVFGLVVSLIANVFGTMALATLLATSMFNAIWAAVVLLVAIHILSALLILTLRSPLARGLNSVRSCSEIIYRRVMGVLRLAGILLWVVLGLQWLQLAHPTLEWCRAVIEHEWAVGTLRISVVGVASFIIAIAIAVIVSKLVRFFLEEDVLSRLNLSRGAPATISTLVHYTILAIGVLLAFAASGAELSSLGFIVGALGVGIGFGLQNIVNNFVSGLILIFERPVKVGDLIEVTGTMGHVTRIGARASTVKTFEGAEVIVPNGNLISSEVVNWTLSDQKRRTEALIPVPLGTDTRRVIEILETVANNQKDILDSPAPYAAFQSFEENGMMFVLRAWPAVGADIIKARTALVAASLEELHKAGIDVPRPQREIRVTRAKEQADSDSTEP